MSAGFALALVATSLALAAARWLPLEIAMIGLVSFGGGLITGYGRWALSASMQILIAMVLALGYPPMDFAGVLKVSASMGVGGAAYIAISLVISRAIAASDRRMMTSELLREFAAYLFAYARFADPQTDLAAVYGRVIRHQAALSEQLQGARALLLEKPRATPERVRLAASIGLILDALDALVAAQCDLPDLRRLPAAAEWMRRIGILVRATALDVQHLGLDLLAHREPSLPEDHQLARDAANREGLRLIADEDTPADVRAAIGRTLARFDAARAAIARLERALGDDAAAEAAIGEIRLSAFRTARSLHPRLLKPHLTPASPVFRYALRLALAMMAGGIVAAELGGERHGNWVLLTISVILRGGYGLTRQRRDDRVIGTLIGCVIASAAVAYSPPWGLLVVQAIGLAVAHGFARLNYRIASTGASMMALVSLHLVGAEFPLADAGAAHRHADRRGDRASVQLCAAELGDFRGAEDRPPAQGPRRRFRRRGAQPRRAGSGLSAGPQGFHGGARGAVGFGGAHGRRAARGAARARRDERDGDRRQPRRRPDLGRPPRRAGGARRRRAGGGAADRPRGARRGRACGFAPRRDARRFARRRRRLRESRAAGGRFARSLTARHEEA